MAALEGGISELSRILVFSKSLGGTAQDVADLARSSLSQCDGVGMQLVDRDGLSTHVFTDTRSSDFDTLQEELDDGPCVQCLRTGEWHDLEPVTSDERWPSFGPSSRQVGLIACLALPLIAQDELIGTMNLYAWPINGFAGWNRRHCDAFAKQASISLASAQAYARTKVLIAELEQRIALVDDIIHQAHGVIMQIEGTNLDGATALLSEVAEAQGSTLDSAAQSVLDSLAASR
jgi:GAF domain-containing protein